MGFDIVWGADDCEYKVIKISDEVFASAKDLGDCGWLVTAKSTDLETSIADAKEAEYLGCQLTFTFD